MSDPAGRDARRAYRGAPVGVRVHVAGRWWTPPLAPIANALSGAARVLDTGCGHGLFPLYLARRHRVPDVVGVDIDQPEVARAAVASAPIPAPMPKYPELTRGCIPAITDCVHPW